MSSPLLTSASPSGAIDTSGTNQAIADSQLSDGRIQEIVAQLFIDLQLLTYADGQARATQCKDLHAKIGELVSSEAAQGSHDLLQEATALGHFLQALSLQKEDITESHLRTVAAAADVLEGLSRELAASKENSGSDFSVVVLDSDDESRSDVSAALVKAGFESVSFATPDDTIQFLETSRTDLVVLNVPVPVPSGFDVSKRIRSLDLHEKTPILVTLIGTPSVVAQQIFIIELVLKALTLVHKTRLAATQTEIAPARTEQVIEETLIESETVENPSDTADSRPSLPPNFVYACDVQDSQDTTLFLHQTGSIVAAQPSSLVMFGWEHEELVGMSVATLLAQEWQDTVLNYLETHCAGEDQGDQAFHVLARKKDSSQFPVTVTLQRLGSDSSCQWTVCFRTARELPQTPSNEAENTTRDGSGEAIFLAMRDSAPGEAVDYQTGSAFEAQEQNGLATTVVTESEPIQFSAAATEAPEESNTEDEAALEAQRRAVELADRLASTSAELDQVKGQLAEHAAEKRDSEVEALARIEAATSAAEIAKARVAEEILERQKLETELTAQQQAREALESKVAAQEQLAEEAERKVAELENKLAGTRSENDSTKAELAKTVADQEQLQADWVRRLNTMQSAFAQAENVAQQKELHCQELREELESAKSQITATQAEAKQTMERVADLQSELGQSQCNLAQAQAQLGVEKADRQKLASAKQSLENEKAQLIENLAHLREQQQPLEQRVSELERKHREGISSIARLTTELENERGERQRAEERATYALNQLQQLHQELEEHLATQQTNHDRIGELEKSLQQREQALARAEAEAQSQAEERELAEQQLRRMGDLSTRFQEQVDTFEEGEKKFKEAHQNLENRLKSVESDLAEAQKQADAARRERERLEQALQESENRLQTLAAGHEAESSRVEVALKAKERERKQLERSVFRAEQEAIQAARDNAMQLQSFRRQLRHPANDLQASVNQLLELGLPEDQRPLADAILENTLLLKTLIHQPGTVSS